MVPKMPCRVVDTSHSLRAFLNPLPVENVRITGGFWKNWLDRVVNRTIPHVYRMLEDTGRIENFRHVARGEKEVEWRIADDSDVYKWVEAASYAVAYTRDEELRELLDGVARDIASAQDDDGYLFTLYAFDKEKRWQNLRDMHELYCAGHLMQAAIAHRRATGQQFLLNTATRFADHIADLFLGGKMRGVPGHPEIELALAELYRETGRQKYLDLAVYFLDERGRGLIGGSPYHIDHKPFRQLEELVGHAVRMLYLCSAATDIYMETGDEELLAASKRLWRNMVSCKMYVTGGVGSRYQGEAFGECYELPDVRAYAESCAAIANVMWNFRLLLATGDDRYADVMELALYNAVLPGLGLDGQSYFYVNPLADRGKHRRKEWYRCACCPPNIARMLASLPGYVYATSRDGLWVNLYAASTARLNIAGAELQVNMYTDYPWSGEIEVELEPEKPLELSLYLRIPSWSEWSEVEVNGTKLEEPRPGAYYMIRRTWRRGDRVRLSLDMCMKLIKAHPFILSCSGRVAVKRGPLVYCFEQADNSVDVWSIALPSDARLEPHYEENLLGGVVTLRGKGYALNLERWKDVLYAPAASQTEMVPVEVKAIPYYAWANREPGPMIIWVHSRE